MTRNKEYFVFISYSRLDNEWAIWFRHELEHYHLPVSFNGRTDVRDNLRKVFRDRDEQVQKTLEDTNNHIVICSPHSVKSETVNKEIEKIIALGKEDHLFPFIVEGDKPENCFPPALRLSKLGGDVNKDSDRDTDFIKVVAGMGNLNGHVNHVLCASWLWNGIQTPSTLLLYRWQQDQLSLKMFQITQWWLEIRQE